MRTAQPHAHACTPAGRQTHKHTPVVAPAAAPAATAAVLALACVAACRAAHAGPGRLDGHPLNAQLGIPSEAKGLVRHGGWVGPGGGDEALHKDEQRGGRWWGCLQQ